MISVGSRDGRKGLSLRYGVEGGDMDLETELEEGEACFQNNNDDDSTIDPDVALSYLVRNNFLRLLFKLFQLLGFELYCSITIN